jgi:aspartyl-tRNA(Asn)/glutamyl-tRNA(Gln) amidotransferase subunit A
VVGLKPTYGRVSRFGIIAYASSFDQVGPMARNVRDCALLLQVIAGHDTRDSTSAPEPTPDYLAGLDREIKGLRIGAPEEYFSEGLEPAIRDHVDKGLSTLERLGARVLPVSLPHTEYAVATYYILVTAEASSNLARFDGVKYGYRAGAAGALPEDELEEMYLATRSQGFGLEARRRIMLGTYVLSAGYYDAYYARAQRARTLIKQDFDRVFQQVDALVTPTTPTTAFRKGEKVDDPLQMYLSDIYTVPVNLSGAPAISIPCGQAPEGLPVGLQIIGPHFGEARILNIAFALEKALTHEL